MRRKSLALLTQAGRTYKWYLPAEVNNKIIQKVLNPFRDQFVFFHTHTRTQFNLVRSRVIFVDAVEGCAHKYQTIT